MFIHRSHQIECQRSHRFVATSLMPYAYIEKRVCLFLSLCIRSIRHPWSSSACVCPYLGLLSALLKTYLFCFVVCLKTNRSALICLKTVGQIFGLTRPNIRKTAPHSVRKNGRRYGNVTHRTGVAPNESKKEINFVSFWRVINEICWIYWFVRYIWPNGRMHESINSNRFTKNAIIMEMINQLEANHFYGRYRTENAFSQLFIVYVYVIKTWTNSVTLTTTSSEFDWMVEDGGENIEVKRTHNSILF